MSTRREQTKQEQGGLWPGESHTFEGVTIAWEMTPEEKTDIGPIGVLKFRGPKTALKVRAPVTRRSERGQYKTERVTVYLDDVAFSIGGVARGPAVSLTFTALAQPRKRTFTAAPHNVRMYISPLCPLQLDQWKISISDSPVRYPDGSEYFELTAVDPAANTKRTLPAVKNAMRKFGRFGIQIREVYSLTETALLAISVDPDEKIQGGDTYARILVNHSGTAGQVLERFGKEYGFKVEWGAAKGHPDSMDYAKGMPVSRTKHFSKGIVKDILGEVVLDNLALEWKTPKHLLVSVTDYDRVLAEREQLAEDLDRQKRLEAEQEAERKARENEFQKKYGLQTTMYELKYMEPEAARILIQPELNIYYLQKAGSRYYASSHPDDRTEVIATVQERCAVDHRTRTLILSATPETLDRVERLIQELDRQVETPRKTPERYWIEIVLLQGGKAGQKVAFASPHTRLSFPRAGLVRELPAKSGAKVKLGDLLALLDRSEVELRLQRAKAELTQLQSSLQVANELYKAAQNLHKMAEISRAELLQAQTTYESTRAKLDAAAADYELAEHELDYCMLRAPVAGTIASVPVRLHERVEAGQVVVGLIPDAATEETTESTPATFDPKIGRQYGISAGDFKLFGFDGLANMGKAVISLAGETGPTGHVVVSVTETYRCELEFLDLRPPYVIVKGRLLAAGGTEPLLENTIFLERGKSPVLGLTNLKQTLLLVLRLHEPLQGGERR